VYCYNLAGVERTCLTGGAAVPAGRHVVGMDFKYDGGGAGKGGTATLTVDGKPTGVVKIPRTLGYRMSLDETLDCGEDTGTPVNTDYEVPFKFTGDLKKAVIKLGGGAMGAADADIIDAQQRVLIGRE
jgi:arylsulfatase